MRSAKPADRLLKIFVVAVPLITLFVPPVTWGVKKIFLIDLMIYAFPFLTLLAVGPQQCFSKNHRWLWRMTSALLTILTLVYFHGYWRTSLQEALDAVDSTGTDGNGFRTFSWIQDGILFSRFASWILATSSLIILAREAGKSAAASAFQTLGKTLGYACALESLLALLFFTTQLKGFGGLVYGYDPEYYHWKNRLYGTLSSPVELGAILEIGVLWWACEYARQRSVKNAGLGLVCFLGLLGSFSFSSIMGVIPAALYLLRHRIKPYLKRFVVAGLIFTASFSYLLYIARDLALQYPWFYDFFLHSKIANLFFRFQPWKIFVTTVLSNPDSALLGLGFARSHTDSSYIHALRVGGVLLLGALLGFLTTIFKRYKQTPHEWGFACTLALCITGLTIDVFFFRVAGTTLLWISALHLALAPEPKYPWNS